jgi:hypothetical protein
MPGCDLEIQHLHPIHCFSPVRRRRHRYELAVHAHGDQELIILRSSHLRHLRLLPWKDGCIQIGEGK